MLTVVYHFWGMKYGSRHVAALADEVRRHLSAPHRQVLACDRPPPGLPRWIETRPLDRTLPVRGCLPKLALFRRDAAALYGGDRLLAIDLDSVAVGPLDPLVARDEDLVLWRNPRPGARSTYNSSLILVTAGARPEIWTTAAADRPENDQLHLSRVAAGAAGEWGAGDGVRASHEVAGLAVLPEGTRIVTFPGPRGDPRRPSAREAHPWLA